MTPTNSQDKHKLTALGCVLLAATGCLLLSVPILLIVWLFDANQAVRVGVFMLLWPVVTMVSVRLLNTLLKALVWLSGEQW